MMINANEVPGGLRVASVGYHEVANKKLVLAKNGVTSFSSVPSQTVPRYGEACKEHADEVIPRRDHEEPGW